MRIAVVTSSYPRFPGDGTAPFVQSICDHLAKLGNEVEVVAPYDPLVKPTVPSDVVVHRYKYIWPKRLHIMGHARSLKADVHLHPLAVFLLPFFLISAFFTLLRVTGRQKSQVIHAHWVIPNGLVAAIVAKTRKIPFIISLHGSDIYMAGKNPLFRAVTRWIFRQASGVTACSPELRRKAVSLGANENITLLPWGADPAIFHPNRRGPTVRQQFGWGSSEIIITGLGRLVYKKGFDTLISALPRILTTNANIRVVIGGDGPVKEELIKLADELGVGSHICFPGKVPWNQVPDYLANSDVFVLPSVQDKHGNIDGLPTVLLEAMSSGTPVIASDIGGVSLVLSNHKTGILLPPGDVPALIDAVIWMVNQKAIRQQYGQAARKTVEEKYNWATVTRQINDLLKQVVIINTS